MAAPNDSNDLFTSFGHDILSDELSSKRNFFLDNALVCISKTKNERLEIKVRLI